MHFNFLSTGEKDFHCDIEFSLRNGEERSGMDKRNSRGRSIAVFKLQRGASDMEHPLWTLDMSVFLYCAKIQTL